MSFWQYQPYRSVAAKRADARKTVAKLTKAGGCSPVVIDGTKISTSFWGKAWCKHIEGWQDYENRLPRGRSYVRHGAVVDLRLATGEITAKVQGSSLYKIRITVDPLPPARWKAFKQLSLGKVGSLLGLLQGKLPDELLRELTDPATGLFPRSKEMKLHCNCPDYSSLCKHLAAALYGVGNRLDSQPELLFTLRGVDHTQLISQAAGVAADLGSAALGDSALAAADLGSIFGIELADSVQPPTAPVKTRKPKATKTAPTAAKKAVTKAVGKTVKKAVRKAPENTAASPTKAASKPGNAVAKKPLGAPVRAVRKSTPVPPPQVATKKVATRKVAKKGIKPRLKR